MVLYKSLTDILGHVKTVATPKQIRELMKVDGLTNDEVKSHLQVLFLTSPDNVPDCTMHVLYKNVVQIFLYINEVFFFLFVHRNIGFTLDGPAQAHKQPEPQHRS